MTTIGRKNADDALILALASGETVEKAAQKAKVSERTAFRRLCDPSFRNRLDQARARLFDQAAGRLAEGMTSAAVQLRNLALNAKSENIRLAASRAVIELGTKLHHDVDLERRIAALEENSRNRGSGRESRRPSTKTGT